MWAEEDLVLADELYDRRIEPLAETEMRRLREKEKAKEIHFSDPED